MMTRVSPTLVSGNGVRLDDCYYRSPYESADRKWLYWASFAAVVLHTIFLLLPLPERDATVPVPARPHSPRITRTVIPPPEIERQTPPQPLVHVRRIPLPASLPDDPGPVSEPLPVIAIPHDAGPIVAPEGPLATPVPPPDAGPLIPDGWNVTMPVLIEQTKVTPSYPPIARAARREGHVILTAIIESDGSVSRTQVIRVDPADFGFEAAAVEAVRQWRYEPSTQNGRPVAVSFTIYVSFNLR